MELRHSRSPQRDTDWLAQKIALYESNGISPNVKNLTKYLYNAIYHDVTYVNKDIWYEEFNVRGTTYTIPYKCNVEGFTVNLQMAMQLPGTVKVKYKIYLIDPQAQPRNYYIVYAYNNTFCESDFANGFIKLESYMIGKYLSDDFISVIQHEASHYFQSYKGQKKNETLYQKAQEMIKSTDEDERNIGWVVYYSFPTEQTAFANQFYRWLMSHYQRNPNIPFDQVVGYSEYSKFLDISDDANPIESDTMTPEKQLDILNKWGIKHSWYVRTDAQTRKVFGIKTYNAYQEFREDTINKKQNEEVIPGERLNDKEFFRKRFLTNKHLDFSYL